MDRSFELDQLIRFITDYISHTRFFDLNHTESLPYKNKYTQNEMMAKIEEFHNNIFKVFHLITGYIFGCRYDASLREFIADRDDKTLIKALLHPSADTLAVEAAINELETWKKKYIDSVLKR